MSRYSSRKDTMPEDDKLKLAQAFNKNYALELFDLEIFIDDINKIVRITPQDAPNNKIDGAGK